MVGLDWIMVFNATFNNISVLLWQPVLLVEESRVHRENHRPVASHWQTLSLYVVSSTPRHELRYQRSNQKPLFEEGHINTMAKRKRTNNDIQNITQKTTQIHQYEAH